MGNCVRSPFEHSNMNVTSNSNYELQDIALYMALVKLMLEEFI